MSTEDSFDLTIEPGNVERQYWYDIWRYRELFYILAWRDVAVQFKQTVIGVLWAILRPLLTMIIFVIVFSKLAQLPSEGVPYPIFVFAAMLPWTFFSTAFSSASNSLINNASLISKVYFPRLLIPAASVFVSALEFIITLPVLLLLMAWYQYAPSWHIITLPLFLLLGYFSALGAGLYISALNVKYRDFRFVVPFIAQLGLYVSPVGYSTTIVPKEYLLFYYLNPMVGVIDGFRWAISGGKSTLDITALFISISVVTVLCVVGITYFRKTEKNFADVI